MKTPLISTIITTYNRTETVKRAIDSVLAQTLQDFEIVIVDDGSTDDTVDYMRKHYSDERIRIIVNEKNMGIGGAKNVGIENAKGKYIAFLDSDDEWMPEKLQLQLNYMQSEPENYPLCFTGVNVYRENSDIVVVRAPTKHQTWLESLLYGETFSLGSTLMATRECFEIVGLFNKNIQRMQDRDWSIRYFDHYQSFSFLKEPLANIYNSGWPNAEMVEHSVNALFNANKKRLKARGDYYVNLFDVSLSFELAVAYYRCGNRLKAIKEIVKLIAKKPSFIKYMTYRFWRKVRQRDVA